MTEIRKIGNDDGENEKKLLRGNDPAFFEMIQIGTKKFGAELGNLQIETAAENLEKEMVQQKLFAALENNGIKILDGTFLKKTRDGKYFLENKNVQKTTVQIEQKINISARMLHFDASAILEKENPEIDDFFQKNSGAINADFVISGWEKFGFVKINKKIQKLKTEILELKKIILKLKMQKIALQQKKIDLQNLRNFPEQKKEQIKKMAEVQKKIVKIQKKIDDADQKIAAKKNEIES